MTFSVLRNAALTSLALATLLGTDTLQLLACATR